MARDTAAHHGTGWQRRWLIVVLVLPGLAGCAAVAPKSPEEAVAERAKARWEHILAGDVESAWELYSPGYRSAVSARALAAKIANQRVRWTDAKFLGVACEPDICHPRFDVTYKYRVPVRAVGVVTNTRAITEDWIRVDGKWFYVPPQSRK